MFTKQVSKRSGMSNLLLFHELQKVTVVGVESRCVEVGITKPLQSGVQQVELDPFLVERKVLSEV